MFGDIAASLNNLSASFFHPRYDRLDPEKDEALNKEPWSTGVDGDFYFVFKLGGKTYVVFGDATGHFDYAGGIKLFIGVALRRLVDGFLRAAKAPTASQLLTGLDREFYRVGGAALGNKNEGLALEDGANVIVLRVDPRTREAEYASAGVPVWAIALDGAIVPFGTMIESRRKMISFPRDIRKRAAVSPEKGSFPLAGAAFLVFLTDGFERLGRLKSAHSGKRSEKMGSKRIEVALQSLFQPKSGKSGKKKSRKHNRKKPGQLRAVDLSEAVIREAQRWRKEHFVPEEDDDDRLVLALDVRRLLAAESRSARNA